MTDIICSNFASRISQATSKEMEKKLLLLSTCPFSPLLITLVGSELWRVISSNQGKDDVKLATLQESLH